jgi:hypothetical protein
MKKLSQSSKPSKVKERRADWDVVRDLYHQVRPALHALAAIGHRAQLRVQRSVA